MYDAIVLAYAEELAARPQERNAVIVLSDGLDNEVSASAYTATLSPGRAVLMNRRAASSIAGRSAPTCGS